MGYLTAGQIGEYHQNGFLTVPGISPQRCDELLELAERHAKTLGYDDFRTLMNPDREIRLFRDLMTDPRSFGIVEELQGVMVWGTMLQMSFKRVGTPYAAQAWNPHQDNSYTLAPPGTYTTINVSLCDSDPENGGLYCYAGSHKKGVYPSEPVLSLHEKAGTSPGNKVVDRYLKGYEKRDLVTKKGDFTLLHGEVVHGSGPNNSDRSRPLIQITYINDRCPFWPGDPRRSNKQLVRLHDNYFVD